MAPCPRAAAAINYGCFDEFGPRQELRRGAVSGDQLSSVLLSHNIHKMLLVSPTSSHSHNISEITVSTVTYEVNWYTSYWTIFSSHNVSSL